MVLYHILYCGLSFVGLHLNYFYFSVHLLDLVMNFKLLKHVLASVLHNYKQVWSIHIHHTHTLHHTHTCKHTYTCMHTCTSTVLHIHTHTDLHTDLHTHTSEAC